MLIATDLSEVTTARDNPLFSRQRPRVMLTTDFRFGSGAVKLRASICLPNRLRSQTLVGGTGSFPPSTSVSKVSAGSVCSGDPEIVWRGLRLDGAGEVNSVISGVLAEHWVPFRALRRPAFVCRDARSDPRSSGGCGADASFHQIGDPFSLWPCPVWRPVRIGLIKREAER